MKKTVKCPLCDRKLKAGTSCECGEFSHAYVGESFNIYDVLFNISIGILTAFLIAILFNMIQQ